MAKPAPSIVPRTDYRAAPKARSGEHPIVKALRDRLQSVHEHLVPAIDAIPSEIPPPPEKGST